MDLCLWQICLVPMCQHAVVLRHAGSKRYVGNHRDTSEDFQMIREDFQVDRMPIVGAMDEHLSVNARHLLHEANFSHYHRGFSGNYVVACSGIDCHVPVFVIALACGAFLLVAFVVAAFIYSRIQYRKAFKNGKVPAKMFLGGTRFGTGSQQSVREEKDKFFFHVQRKTSREEPVGAGEDDGCPVCLKEHKDITVWIVLQCSHKLCERCFNRIVHRNRLHSTCPLCRKYLAEDTVGDGDRGPLPAVQGRGSSSQATQQTELDSTSQPQVASA